MVQNAKNSITLSGKIRKAIAWLFMAEIRNSREPEQAKN